LNFEYIILAPPKLLVKIRHWFYPCLRFQNTFQWLDTTKTHRYSIMHENNVDRTQKQWKWKRFYCIDETTMSLSTLHPTPMKWSLATPIHLEHKWSWNGKRNPLSSKSVFAFILSSSSVPPTKNYISVWVSTLLMFK